MPQTAQSSSRRDATRQRRRQILDAALECFASRGYGATTMAHIRDRAGASTGSIYHHFKSKDHLAAELYLEGIRGSQERGLLALTGCRSAEEGIKALVAAYLGWVRDHPHLATFLFTMRHADFMEPVEERVDQMNRGAFERASEWFRARIESGELPNLAPDVLRAILYGPAAHYARRHLSGEADTDLETATERLAQAAWDGLRGLRGG
ncbi:MAG: TetR/AcrR family transcriptional regulator [Myxococcales bacterium]|jgi:AcrR family transcriptional regulator